MNPSFKHERKLWQRGLKVAGVDEVGRGALAGPIVAAAVILSPKILRPKAAWLKQVKDSKKLTIKVRVWLYNKITKNSHWAIAVLSNKQIDKIGIQQANREVVWRAVANLPVHPHYLLLDWVANFRPSANRLLQSKLGELPYRALIRGDETVASITCASIIAKVERDRLMVAYEQQYPGYGFVQHKGYGTLQHQQVLIKRGPCPIHRRSFKLLPQPVTP